MCTSFQDDYMDAFSASLALCVGNPPPVTSGSPAQRASNAELYYFFVVSLDKLLSKYSSYPCNHDLKVPVTSSWHEIYCIIGFGDNTDLLWWNNENNQFCQLTTRVSHQRGIRRPFKCIGNHTYWGLKNNWGVQSKNGLQNLWGNTVFFILC